eukprot:GHVP01025011.1.p1 GENE.GHVP01025011.1~~GHVP01025011.1.p1  ORF type:complete len:470 (+),score=83.11 GHVP01025011.1:1176-2585(+)
MDFSQILPKQNVQHLEQIKSRRQNILNRILTERRLPDKGLDDLSLRMMLDYFAASDSNNISNSIGVGEREGRVFSPLVQNRYFGLAHGIGRSGDLLAIQPKALGSSAVNHLAKNVAEHALKELGLIHANQSVILPMATSMSVSFVINYLRQKHVEEFPTTPSGKLTVLWFRVDQKACFKAVEASGLRLIILPAMGPGNTTFDSFVLQEAFKSSGGRHNIVCVLATTLAFAPRIPDDVIQIGRFCKKVNTPLVVNNAYGLQCPRVTARLNHAALQERVDFIVSSCDKTFLVPVGGSVVSSPRPDLVSDLANFYPGRASIGPSLDMLMTLLQMGSERLRAMCNERQKMFEDTLELTSKMFLDIDPNFVVECPENSISIAVSLRKISVEEARTVGPRLFTRQCTGARVVTGDKSMTVDSGRQVLANWGSHGHFENCPYLTFAVAFGANMEDIRCFLEKLHREMEKSLGKSGM